MNLYAATNVLEQRNGQLAPQVLAKFAAKGFSLEAITAKLTADGVKSFDESFSSLMSTIEARRDSVTRGLAERVSPHLGGAGQAPSPANRT